MHIISFILTIKIQNEKKTSTDNMTKCKLQKMATLKH